MDDTSILFVSSVRKSNVSSSLYIINNLHTRLTQNTKVEEIVEMESVDYSEIALDTEFQDGIVNYIAGFVEKKIKLKIKCEGCSEAISSDQTVCGILIKLKKC